MPEKATFHFVEGLKDYLAASIEGQTLVHPDIFFGKSQKPGGHGSVEWAIAFVGRRRRLPLLLLQHHPDRRRRHP